MVGSRYKVGTDGKTPYERLKGRRRNMVAIPFGEAVWYKQLKDEEGRGGHRMESDWKEGVWLGHARSTSETIIGAKEGAVKAWAVKRRPEEERWNKEAIWDMVGTPSQPDPSKSGVSIPIKISIPNCDDIPLDEVVPPKEPEAPRSVYIKQRQLQQYGYTPNCEACKRMKAGGMKIGGARPHTEECRNRIEAEMEKDEEGRTWKRKSDGKRDQYLDQKVKEAEEERQKQEETEKKVDSSDVNDTGVDKDEKGSEEGEKPEDIPVPADEEENKESAKEEREMRRERGRR